MDDLKPPPKIFANHVIRQMVSHLLGEQTVVDKDDFMVLRTAFRSLGGQWSALSDGSMQHLEILQNVISQWAMMKPPQKEDDEAI